MTLNTGPRTIPHGCIGVIASADENYAPYLTVMFFSLLKNCPAPEQVMLYCIDGGIAESTKQQMLEAVKQAGGTGVDFIEFDKKKYEALPTKDYITSSVYYRISIPEIFSADVSKIIYLDCDMIVRGNIFELWSINIDDCHVGAVENVAGHTYRKLGIPQNEYFNSGMLLINLNLWRRDNISEKVFRFKVENPHRISTNDQCALNGVLHDKWKHLPLKWNHQIGLYRKSAQLNSFDKGEVREALLNPQIIHYVTWDKPWRKVRFHPLASEYDRYADQLTIPQREEPGLMDYVSAYSSVSRLKKLIRYKRWQRWYRKQGYPLYNR